MRFPACQMDAHKAERIGLVHEVYPDDEFEQRVRDFCANLLAQPQEVVGTSKLTIELCKDLDRAQARNVERMTVSMLTFGDEFKERLAAHRDKVLNKKKKK